MRKRIQILLGVVLVLAAVPALAGGPIKIVHLGDIPLPGAPVSVEERPLSDEVWVSLNDGSIVVVDPARRAVVARIPDVGAGSWGLAFHPDGSQVYGTNWMANEVVVIDADRRVIQRKINVGLKPAFVCIDPGGNQLAVSNFFSGELSLVDMDGTTCHVEDVDVGRRPMGLAVDYKRRVAYVGSGAAHTLTTFDLVTRRVVGTRKVQFASTHDMDITRDGSLLLAAGFPDSLILMDPRDENSVVEKVSVGKDPVGVAVDPWGRYAFVTNYQDSSLSVVEIDTRRQIQTYPTAEAPMFLTVDSKGRRLYVCASRAKALSVFALGDRERGLRPTAAAAGLAR